jgi:hypothetical protein
MASYNAARFEQGTEPQKATVLLDMGALATDLIVMEGNRIWSRPIPIGGNRFTEALVTAFKISFRKGEKLKRSAATSKYARQVFQAMRPVFADLVSEVQRSVGYYTSTHREAQIARVIGMGNAFKLPGLQKFLNQNLQIEVERLSGFKKMTSAANLEVSPAFADNVSSFAVAYGLAIQGMGLAGVQSNLLPLEVHKTLLWRKKRPWFVATAASLAIAGASLWVGNILAGGQISSALGNLQSISVYKVSNKDEAERIINGGGGDAALEKAAKVAGASDWFQSELSRADSRRSGDQGLLKSLARLPENNVFVPRIIDIVHRALDSAASPEIKKATTVGEYRKLAEQIPDRSERHYLWADRIEMIFSPQDPAAAFLEPGQKTSGPRKAGWAVLIKGGTSDPKPAKWLDESVIRTLEKIGRTPGMGFYVEKATLAKVMKRPSESTTVEQDAPLTGGEGGGTSGRGGGGGGPRGGGRGPRGGGGGGPEGRGGGGRAPGFNFGGGGSTGGPPPPEKGGGGSVPQEKAAWREKVKNTDLATGEKTTDDQSFIIQIVIRKGDTPPQLLPDEFKPKKPEAKKPPAKKT